MNSLEKTGVMAMKPLQKTGVGEEIIWIMMRIAKKTNHLPSRNVGAMIAIATTTTTATAMTQAIMMPKPTWNRKWVPDMDP